MLLHWLFPLLLVLRREKMLLMHWLLILYRGKCVALAVSFAEENIVWEQTVLGPSSSKGGVLGNLM